MIIGAFVAVCGLAAAGWMRKNDRPADNLLPGSAQAAPYAASPYAQNTQPPYNSTGVSAGQGYYSQAPIPQPVYTGDGYYPTHQRPVYIRQEEPAPVYQPAPRRVYQEQEYYTDARGHRRGRTKTHSVEIVAGTAAVGAVIGGIAGGGKGAALGAVSGGGAGFIYDRLTHNK